MYTLTYLVFFIFCNILAKPDKINLFHGLISQNTTLSTWQMTLFVCHIYSAYMNIRGVIKNVMDWRCKILVTQSILLIFTLAIIIYKFNKYFKIRREIVRKKIDMTFYRIKGISTRRRPPVTL